MIRPFLTRILTRALAWTAIVAFAAVSALAQSPTAPAAPAQRTDGQIEMDVVHALDASQALKNDLITAATIQGKVTLAGTVASQANKDLAQSIVSAVPGVTGVENNLKIGNPQDAQAEQPPAEDTSPDFADNTPPQTESPGQPSYAPLPPPDAAPSQPPYPSQSPYPGQPPYPGQAQAPPQPYSGQAPGYPPSPYAQPQYAPQPQPTYQPASGPVTIPAGTLLQVRTSEPVDSKRAAPGTPVQFTVIQDVSFGGVLAIPRGATLHGVVTDVRNVHAGQLAGSPELALTLTSLDLGGKNYPIHSDNFRVKGPNKAGRTVGSALSGGLIGTIIGCAVGRGTGCAIGAGAGLAAGTAASAASRGPGAWIPAEARVDFHLAAPVTVDPVSPQEAARLAQGLYPGGPTLYRRGYYPYARPYGAPYPYYAYPPVYYRPYYMMGGVYYWR